MPIEENGHTSAYNAIIKELLADYPEEFRNRTSFGKGFLEEEEKPKYKYHIAKTSETLYRICVNYNISQEDFRTWNKMASNDTNIEVGRKYIVGVLTIDAEKEAPEKKAEEKRIEKNNIGNKEYSKATNFKDLVSLVRDFETCLLKNGEGKFKDAFHRVKTIRGCFYGTEWSFDYAGADDKGHEQSSIRNVGFNLMTDLNYGGWRQVGYATPHDPRNYVPESLFKALRASPEVRDHSGKKIDFGHIVIGVEARFHDRTRLEEFTTLLNSYGGTGLECVTFLGDLGGGAGMLAYIRAMKSSTIRAKKIVFDSANDYGATINIEGDIGAYLVGAYSNSEDGIGTGFPSKTWLKESDYFADALEQYLLPENFYQRINKIESKEDTKLYKAWNVRYELIIQSLGMKILDKKIENIEHEINKWAKKIKTFGESYISIRVKDKSLNITQTQEDNMYKHLDATSVEVATIFIKTLDDNIGKTALFKPSSRFDLPPTKIY